MFTEVINWAAEWDRSERIGLGRSIWRPDRGKPPEHASPEEIADYETSTVFDTFSPGSAWWVHAFLVAQHARGRPPHPRDAAEALAMCQRFIANLRAFDEEYRRRAAVDDACPSNYAPLVNLACTAFVEFWRPTAEVPKSLSRVAAVRCLESVAATLGQIAAEDERNSLLAAGLAVPKTGPQTPAKSAPPRPFKPSKVQIANLAIAELWNSVGNEMLDWTLDELTSQLNQHRSASCSEFKRSTVHLSLFWDTQRHELRRANLTAAKRAARSVQDS